MVGHEHYDIEEIEGRMRADMEALYATALANAGAARPYIETQHLFADARIAFVLAPLRAVNAGHDHADIIGAMGVAIGECIATAMSELDFAGALFLTEKIQTVVTELMAIDRGAPDGVVDTEGATMSVRSINPMKGGTA